MRIDHHFHNHRSNHSLRSTHTDHLEAPSEKGFIMANLPPATQLSDTSAEPGPDQTLAGAIDGTLDVDTDMNLDTQPTTSTQEPAAESLPEPPPAPTKKDISLRDFIAKMDDYAPIVRLPTPFLHSLSTTLPQVRKASKRHTI